MRNVLRPRPPTQHLLLPSFYPICLAFIHCHDICAKMKRMFTGLQRRVSKSDLERNAERAHYLSMSSVANDIPFKNSKLSIECARQSFSHSLRK